MEERGQTPKGADTPRHDALVFLGIAALAFVVRLVHLLQARAVPLFDATIMDGRSYSEWADRIAAGDWLGDTIFYQAPLYPYFLAVVKLGVGDDLWRIRLFQIALGSISCSILFLAGRSFFSRRVGIVAGVLLALYPPAIFFDGLIQKAGLGLVLTALLLWFLARASPREGRDRGPLRFVLVGAALGLLMLTREETILLAPVIAVWCWFVGRKSPAWRRIHSTLGYAAGLAVILVPVGLRNHAVGGEFVLTTSQAGPNFYIGNHAGATGSYVPLKPGRQNTAYERKDAVELAEQASGRSLTPKEVSDYWRDRAIAWIRSDPGAWVRLLLRKTDLFLNAYEMPDYEDQYFYERDCSLLRSLDTVWHYGILLPLAVAGIVLAWGRIRETWIIHALLATMAVAVVLFYVFARYRYPVVPIIALFAGAGLVEGLAAFRPRRGAAIVALVALLAAAAISNRPLFEKDRLLAESLSNAGAVLSSKGEDEKAVALFEESIRLRPDVPEILGNLGLSQMRLGRVDDAIESFAEVARLRSNDWKSHLRLGAALEQAGRVDAGVAAIARAIALDPKAVLDAAFVMIGQTQGRDLVAIDILSSALAANGRFEEASAVARKAADVPVIRENAELRSRILVRLEAYEAQKR
jgi:hypothetical protein